MVSLIAATGLRIGDLLALRWMALDLEGGTWAVRKSVFEGTFQPPKTQRALRRPAGFARAVQALKEHRERSIRTEDATSRSVALWDECPLDPGIIEAQACPYGQPLDSRATLLPLTDWAQFRK